MSTTVEQIKDRLSIVDVVSGYLKLDKAGVNFKARCPFHNEKTSSFFVSPTRGTYHCFGCHKGGDIISFIQEIEGVEFKEALKMLADKAGVEINFTSNSVKGDYKKELKNILAKATVYYQSNLKQNKVVLDYLIDRGLTLETISKFNLGFSLPDWQGVTDFLLAKGFKSDDIVKAGLALFKKDSQNKLFDRFRSRIMFPLKDAGGYVVGFSARIYGRHSDTEAKYINSPQTDVYDKSRILYGLDMAKVSIRRQDQAVLVEGQMDMLMCHQIGLDNVVAVSGTALTENHLSSLKRLSNNLIMAFDADKAGIEASKRAVEIALNLGLEIKIAILPSGLDPADLAKSDPDKLKECINKAVHVIDFYLQVITTSENDLRLRARRLKLEVYPFIEKLIHLTDKAYFVRKIAGLTNLNEDVIWADLKSSPTTGFRNTLENKIPTPKSLNLTSRHHKIIEELIGIRFFLEDKKDNSIKDIDQEITRVANDLFLKSNLEKFNPRKNELILAVEVKYEDLNKIKEFTRELLLDWEKEYLREELKKATSELKQAETAGEVDLIDKLLKKCQDISNKINHL